MRLAGNPLAQLGLHVDFVNECVLQAGVQIFGAQPGATKTGAFSWGAFDPWKPAALLQVQLLAAIL